MRTVTKIEAKELHAALTSTVSATHQCDALAVLARLLQENPAFEPEAWEILCPFMAAPEK
jgi:hypothetical protein